MEEVRFFPGISVMFIWQNSFQEHWSVRPQSTISIGCQEVLIIQKRETAISNQELVLELLYFPSSLQSTYFLTGLSCLRTYSGRHAAVIVALLIWRRYSQNNVMCPFSYSSKGFRQRRWCFIFHHTFHISVASCTALWAFNPLDWSYVICLVALCTHNSQHCHNSLQLLQSTHIL